MNFFKNIKTHQLLWMFQLVVIVYFYYASYNYHVNWCNSNHYYFDNYQFYWYTLANLFIVLIFPLINHFYLYDKLLNKKLFWVVFITIPIQLYTSMVLNALMDTLFLKRYNVPWLMWTEHINSRFFINFSFIGLFGIQKMLQVYFKKAEDEKKLKIGQLESEIKLLRAQINPHFLFNSLNNIYSYAVQKKDETPELILKLSEILRFLSDTKNSESYIDAQNEINVTKDLFDLYLVNKRWITKAKLTIQITNSDVFYIEPHTILTLAENAFKYCNLDEESAFLQMEIFVHNNELTCKLENTIRKDKPLNSDGTGLINLKKRLDITYNKNYLFHYQEENNIFKTELKLPLLDNQLLHNRR